MRKIPSNYPLNALQQMLAMTPSTYRAGGCEASIFHMKIKPG